MKRKVHVLASMALSAFCAITAVAQTSMKERKVLFIGIDGVRSDALQAANTPVMDSLMGEGISTFDSWHLGITSSGPSWSSMMTGVWEPKHFVTNNGYGGANFANYPYFTSRAKEVDPTLKTVQIITWNPMGELGDNPGGYVYNSNWDISIDAGGYGQGLITAATKIQLLDPDLDILFIHYDECDGAGHSTGFSPTNAPYINAIEGVDVEIGQVVQAIKNRPNYANEDWLILCTTDHGGNGTGHGGNSNNERHIWWFGSNANMPKTTLTGTDPGSYQMSSNPVDTAILANTPVLTDIAVTALDWILPFTDIKQKTAWDLDGKSWVPDSLGVIDTSASTFGNQEYLLNKSIVVYPNPATDVLTISAKNMRSSEVSFALYSITGKRVYQNTIKNNSEVNVDLSELSSGLYMLQIDNGNAVISRKIIVQ